MMTLIMTTSILIKRVLDFDDKVHLMDALFKTITPTPTPITDQIKDIVTCLTMAEIQEYMRDIGITIIQTSFGQTLQLSTINGDKDWIDRKVNILFKHLNSKVIGE